MMTLINVSRDDIDNGERSNCLNCAIVRAVRAATGEPNVIVRPGWDGVTVWLAGRPYPVHGVGVSAWIRAYDRGDLVAPIVVGIDLGLHGDDYAHVGSELLAAA